MRWRERGQRRRMTGKSRLGTGIAVSNQRATHELIRSLAGSDNKIVAHRLLCEYMGSLEGGVFLSQLLYWSDKGKDGWFYKSYREWEEEIYLTEYQVKKASKLCVERGFLEVGVKKANGAPTVHYRLSFEKFLESIPKFLTLDSEKFGNPIQEISETYKQKNTTKITTKSTAGGEEEGHSPPPSDPPVELSVPRDKSGKRIYKSRHINKDHFDAESGLVPFGDGATAVEVYYERFDFRSDTHRLTRPMEDDLVRGCPDLELLREVVTAYDQSSFVKPRNVKLILDWYKEPSRFRNNGPPGASRSNPTSKVAASLAAVDEYERLKAQHGVNQ